MKKDLMNTIEIPEGIEIILNEDGISVSGPEGKNIRKLNMGRVNIEKKDNALVLSCLKSTKREKKIINTLASHIKNMIKGVQEKFEYKLKVCSSHFPMSVEIKSGKATVKNFLGEKVPRSVKIVENSEVKIDGDIITITSSDKEIAGQCAANFEAATKVRNKDRRVFQDGIFMITKSGRAI